MEELYKAKVIDSGPLTARESEVLKYLCMGYTRDQIKDSIHRSYGSVSKHVESIARKLQVTGTKAIIIHAIVHNMVNISLKSILLVLTLNSLYSHPDMRRPPRVPSVRIARTKTEYS